MFFFFKKNRQKTDRQINRRTNKRKSKKSKARANRKKCRTNWKMYRSFESNIISTEKRNSTSNNSDTKVSNNNLYFIF